MKLSYEKACIEAGLSKEEINEIRKIFQNDKQRLRRENEFMELKGLVCFSLTLEGDYPNGFLDIPDERGSAEEIYIHQLALDTLQKVLSSFEEEEIGLVLAFTDKSSNFSDYARTHGMTRKAALYRANKIFEKVKEDFFKEF